MHGWTGGRLDQSLIILASSANRKGRAHTLSRAQGKASFYLARHEAEYGSTIKGEGGDVVCTAPFAQLRQLDVGRGKIVQCAVPSAALVCKTTAGVINIAVHPHWAPIGAARLITLVQRKFFTDIPLWRHNGMLIQFGADQKSRPGFEDIRDIQIADDAHIEEANPKKGLPKVCVLARVCGGGGGGGG
jgi:hypothetical protein